jgi:hypothetical protein
MIDPNQAVAVFDGVPIERTDAGPGKTSRHQVSDGPFCARGDRPSENSPEHKPPYKSLSSRDRSWENGQHGQEVLIRISQRLR